MICIEDPLREEAKTVIETLHGLGLSNIVMMTGDNERTARSVAEKVGVDTYYSEVLPVSCRLRHLLCCIMHRHWR